MILHCMQSSHCMNFKGGNSWTYLLQFSFNLCLTPKKSLIALKIVLPAFFPLSVLSRKVNPEIHRVWEFPEIYFLRSQLWQKILGHYFLLVMHKIFWVWIMEKRDMIGQKCLGSPFGALHCLYEWTARPKLMSDQQNRSVLTTLAYKICQGCL